MSTIAETFAEYDRQERARLRAIRQRPTLADRTLLVEVLTSKLREMWRTRWSAKHDGSKMSVEIRMTEVAVIRALVRLLRWARRGDD